MRKADFGFVAIFSDFKSDLCAIPPAPGVKPGFAAPDLAVLFGYAAQPLDLAPGIQPGSPDWTIKVGPRRHGDYFQSGFRQHDRQLTVQG